MIRMECWTTGMKTLWILVAGPWLLVLPRTLSLACEFVFFNGLVLLLTKWIWLRIYKLHFRFWVLQGSSKPISFWHFIWGRWKSHKSSTSVRKIESFPFNIRHKNVNKPILDSGFYILLCLCEFKDCCKTTISLAKSHRSSARFQDFRRWISQTTDYPVSFRGLWTSWIVSNTCEYAILMCLFLLSRVWLTRNCRERIQSTI